MLHFFSTPYFPINVVLFPLVLHFLPPIFTHSDFYKTSLFAMNFSHSTEKQKQRKEQTLP